MKKYILFIPFAVVYILAVIYFFFFFMTRVDVGFADAVTLVYDYKGVSIQTDITDAEELAALKEACGGSAVSHFSAPASEFGNCVLIFKKEDREVILYPSCDSNYYLRVGETNKYIDASQEKRELMVEILGKYGAVFPCSDFYP